jgi:hypothetical protein
MKKTVIAILFSVLIAGFASLAHASLDGFLGSLNVQARADIPRYNMQISAQFGVPVAQVEDVMRRMPSPADGFMVFQLGTMTSRPPETVVSTFEKHHGKGWGVIAKDLGIKPGSPEFHRLKRGDFALTGKPVNGSGHGKGEKHKENGNGKGHGHND